MPSGHTPFAVFNRTANPLVGLLLRAPLGHRLASRRLALITVTGRKTGREHTFPVGYTQRGDTVRIVVGWPERKVWWRNLRGGEAPVRIRIQGRERTGHATAQGDPRSGVTVTVKLDPGSGG
ncbi:MAG: nitroreductase family deazaflavin-dependent oxidoreductase [Actinobacteria bacterium]|nr:MAG: nitroreductase family deazaflavin-dependent oxidoreductase [Actinomycetota bacterium]